MAKARRPPNRLLGVGLDGQDQHRRITRGDGFALVGGSEETHDRMTETVIKTTEELSRKGRTIVDARPEELADLLRKHERRD